MTAPTRILLVDDHPVFRYGVRRLLETSREFEVVAEATDGAEAVAAAASVKPQVVLLDLAMPRQHGLDTVEPLTALPGAPRVVVLTASIERAEVVEALQAGAAGVVLKDAAARVLLDAVRAVAAGRYWLGPEPFADLVSALRQVARPEAVPEAPPFGLSPRELDIVSAVVAGDANKAIGERFGLSTQTVKHHLTSIFSKVGVSSRLELALFALRHRLVCDR